jgi:cobalt-zinc-cadmium efflux system membrane fusion protein
MGRSLPWAGLSVCLTVLLAHVAYDVFAHAHTSAGGKADPRVEVKAEREPAASRRAVSESDFRLKEARITIEPARYDRIATGIPVVGMIQVNADRQFEVRPRSAGIVREVHVVQGQNVKRGDALVTLDSPEIGTARLNLRAKQRELSTARFEARWRSEIAANVALLIPKMQKGINERRAAYADDEEHTDITSHEHGKGSSVPPGKGTDARRIEKEFADKQLGAYRGTLLQPYAEFDIASHEEQKTVSLRNQNILGEHPALVARHTREGVQAKLEAAIEQVRFDAAQEKRLADQRAGQAEAAVVDAAQRLRILGVSENIQELLDNADLANTIARDEDVTFYRIVAPFDGTIIKKYPNAVPSQKAETNDILFALADLRSVWLTANISESDVDMLSSIKDGTFHFSASSYPNRDFTARLLSRGAVVDPQTRTVPLLAQADNPDDILKLNMFVKIMLDNSATERVLTVPAGAVVDVDGEKYVFVPSGREKDNHRFTLRPVEAGRQTGDRVEIKSGLTEGDKIVASGAFFLKSDLILQSETEE